MRFVPTSNLTHYLTNLTNYLTNLTHHHVIFPKYIHFPNISTRNAILFIK